MGIKAVLFDCSGTLVSDLIATWLSFKKYFELYGINLSFKTFKEEFCLPCSLFLYKMKMPRGEIQQFPEIFNNLYIESLEYVRPFPDVQDCISKLIESGVKLGIVSATPEEPLFLTLEKLGLNKNFEIVTGDAEKPSPKPIINICEGLRIIPRRDVFYVGDMIEDIISAKRAGITPIAISRSSGGYHNMERLKAQGPTYIISDLRELVRFVTQKM